MKVVQLIPNLQGGGAERGCVDLAQSLVDQGHQSIVISNGGRMVADLEQTGATHIQLDIASKSLGAFWRVGGLRKLLTQLAPDVVHARSRLPAWMAWLALRKMDRKPVFVTTLHGLNSVSFYSSVMLKADHVIAVSKTVRDYWQQHYLSFDPGKTTMIPRGLSLSPKLRGYHPGNQWEADFRKQIGCGDQPLLTLPGRISPIKGQMAFVELIEQLLQAGQRCHGLIVGGGEAARVEALREEIRRRNLNTQITLCGHRDDLPDLMAVSTLVFSLTTKPESYGRTVAEALTLGKPLIGYDHGGVAEMLQRAFPEGRVPPNDTTQLFQTTHQLLADCPTVNAFTPYTVEQMTGATIHLYKSLLNPSSNGLT